MESHTLLIHWFLLILLSALDSSAVADVHFHDFVIAATPVTRLCSTRNVITVNGQFPGPTLEVRDGDTLVIKAINRAQYNLSLHWHGIRQMRNPWADGPEYITQCPIQPGQSYTYRFTIRDQEGTLWWHAHSKWLRASVYGALLIHPKLPSPYNLFSLLPSALSRYLLTFRKLASSNDLPIMPKRQVLILLGEWWGKNPMDVLAQALFTGAAINASDAYTINGQPGDLYKCSTQDTVTFEVKTGETILLRIINSALNQELFFAVANHNLTVVGVDASHTKPFTTDVVVIGSGQTTNALLTAHQPHGLYYMAAQAYNSSKQPFGKGIATAILKYKNPPSKPNNERFQNAVSPETPVLPRLPGFHDMATATVAAYRAQIKSPSKVDVPNEIDVNLFFTVGLGLSHCPDRKSSRCQGPYRSRFTASMNNVSFVFPRRDSVMQEYYEGKDELATDFPSNPPLEFNYTGNVDRRLWQPDNGTSVFKVKFGARVQIVLQGTSILTVADHPIHLHGYDFFVIGTGSGNYGPKTDPFEFNLVDPPRRNTVGTPPGGWVAIRFVADNPGAWLMHCHIDAHLSWGLAMVFLVENGVGELQSVQPPPKDLPQC